MTLYIRATGNISPQKTFGHPPFLNEPVKYSGNRLTCVEPDYKSIIDVKLIRRMSRIIQMGVAAATECLQEADVTIPDAIVTGTAYGCLQDTGVFLSKMVEQNEELLTPTAFIQSTHNTIGAQIALMLQCNQYNNAFVHRGFSFESALLDGMMLLMENPDTNVLVGAVDEITDHSHLLLNRMGLYKQDSVSNMDLFIPGKKGTIAGEGASFFLLTDQPSANNYAKLDAITTFYKPDVKEIESNIQSFLSARSLDINDIDVIITGKNGDTKNDKIYAQLKQTVFNRSLLINYKNLSGEYPTSTAFALWLAVNIIKTTTIPAILQSSDNNQKPVKKILIYNHYQNIHHSLLLVSAC